MAEVLTVQKLWKYLGQGEDRKTILENISFSLHAGDFASIMGPSGAGKSTLLYTVSGLEQADAGEIYLKGQEIRQMSDEERTYLRREHLGFVFQEAHFIESLSLLDNIILLAEHRKLDTRRQLINRARGLMEEMGIGALAERTCHEVSGGQLQRASICRALLNRPDLLIADEPTGALHSQAAQEIMNIFTDLQEAGKTLLLVTHDPKVAAQTDRVLFLRDGKLVEGLDFGKERPDDQLGLRVGKINRVMEKLEDKNKEF